MNFKLLSTTAVICLSVSAAVSHADVFAINVNPENIEQSPTGRTSNLNVGFRFTINGFETTRDGELYIDGFGANTKVQTSGIFHAGILSAFSFGSSTPNPVQSETIVSSGGTLEVGSAYIGSSSPSNRESFAGVGTVEIFDGGTFIVGTEEPNLTADGFDSLRGLIAIGVADADSNGDAVNGTLLVGGFETRLESGSIFVGTGADSPATGELEIRDGATVVIQDFSSLESASFINFPGLPDLSEVVDLSNLIISADSRATITGSGTSVVAGALDVGSVGGSQANRSGFLNDSANTRGRLEISDGASVEISGAEGSSIGGFGGTGALLIDGGALFDPATELVIKDPGYASATRSFSDFRIGDWGFFRDPSGDFLLEAGDGVVEVTRGAALEVEGTVFVGGTKPIGELADFGYTEPAASKGRLTVSDFGYVVADEVRIGENGILDGDSGDIFARTVLEGGTIAPGASPGILNIFGDLEILDGLLEIEIAGTGAGMFDQLNITGDLIASTGFDIEINFLDSFIPQEGDIFNFLNVGGDSSIFDTPSLINFSVNGGGFFGSNAALNFAGGNLSLISDGMDVAPVPLPAGLPMLVAGLAGLGWLGKRRKAQTTAS